MPYIKVVLKKHPYEWATVYYLFDGYGERTNEPQQVILLKDYGFITATRNYQYAVRVTRSSDRLCLCWWPLTIDATPTKEDIGLLLPQIHQMLSNLCAQRPEVAKWLEPLKGSKR